MTTSVLLVDDHPIIRAALRNALETISEDIVCSPASSLEEAIAGISLSHPPDLVLLDLNLPDACGIATLHAFRRRFPGLQVVALSDSFDVGIIDALKATNALTLIPKSNSLDQILISLKKALAACHAAGQPPTISTAEAHAAEPSSHIGQHTMQPGATTPVPFNPPALPDFSPGTGPGDQRLDAPMPPAQPRRIYQDGRHLGLTERQRCVLKLMMMGLPNKAIGRKLKLAEGTVKVHVSAVLRALGVKSRAQVTLAALSCGIRMEAIVLPEVD
ncbi:MAG: response regulator transcription factor [Lautropia sp.]|nr:response regulator transcription factor [Lautropia sp.]